MKGYKAGDFTNGKMNEIFKAASGGDFGIVDIEHKQQGGFKLMSVDGFNAIIDSILRFNFGIIRIDGELVSVFDYAELAKPEEAIAELNYIIEFHGLNADFVNKSYMVLHQFKDALKNLDCHSICDLSAFNFDYHFESSYSRSGAGSQLLKKKKISKDQVSIADALCGNFEAAITKAIENEIAYMIENEDLEFDFDAGSIYFAACEILTDSETCIHSESSINLFKKVSNDLFKMIMDSDYFYAKFNEFCEDEIVIK